MDELESLRAELRARLAESERRCERLHHLAEVVLLPMAKGYAAEHPVGRNAEMVADAETALSSAPAEPGEPAATPTIDEAIARGEGWDRDAAEHATLGPPPRRATRRRAREPRAGTPRVGRRMDDRRRTLTGDPPRLLRVDRPLRHAGARPRPGCGASPMIRSPRRAQVARMDALCRRIVMDRDGHRCQKCGSPDRVQWCHVRSRRYHSTRWSPENSLALCSGCHLWMHGNPTAFTNWFQPEYPDRAQYLALAAATVHKVDLNLIEVSLKQEAKKRGLI